MRKPRIRLIASTCWARFVPSVILSFMYLFWNAHYKNKGIIITTHLILLDHQAALVLPLAMFFLCLALNDLRFAFMRALSPAFGLPAVLAPLSPKRIIFTLPPSRTATICDFLPLADRLGLFKPESPNRLSFFFSASVIQQR